MSKKKQIVLPRTPSLLLSIALHDLKEVEKLKRQYKVWMGSWHIYDYDDKKCSVCFAGSVMARTLGVKDKAYKDADDMANNERQLEALNKFREGRVDDGLSELGLGGTGIDNIPIDRKVVSYDSGRKNAKERFKKQMAKLIKEFQAVGL